MLTSWTSIYKDRINIGYEKYFRQQYHPFIDILKTYKYKEFMEIGCGSATTSKILMDDKHIDGCFLIDNDLNQLSLAKERLKNHDNVGIFNADITNKSNRFSYHGVIHSHGVLEHFNDDIIKRICKSIDKNINQIHYVPLDKWLIPSRGDERLLSKEHWINLLNPQQIVTFNNDKDAIIINPFK